MKPTTTVIEPLFVGKMLSRKRSEKTLGRPAVNDWLAVVSPLGRRKNVWAQITEPMTQRQAAQVLRGIKVQLFNVATEPGRNLKATKYEFTTASVTDDKGIKVGTAIMARYVG